MSKETDEGAYDIEQAGDQVTYRRRLKIIPRAAILGWDARAALRASKDQKEIVVLDDNDASFLDKDYETDDWDLDYIYDEVLQYLKEADAADLLPYKKDEIIHSIYDYLNIVDPDRRGTICKEHQVYDFDPYALLNAPGGKDLFDAPPWGMVDMKDPFAPLAEIFTPDRRRKFFGGDFAPPTKTDLGDLMKSMATELGDGIKYVITEWVIPRPDESYESAGEYADQMVAIMTGDGEWKQTSWFLSPDIWVSTPETKLKAMAEKGEGLRTYAFVIAAGGFMGHSIMTVVQCVPLIGNIVGKASKAGKATKFVRKVLK